MKNSTAKSKLNTAQKNLFGSKKEAQVNGFTVKYYEIDGALRYAIYSGKGKGSQLTSSANWKEIVSFVYADKKPVYRSIYSGSSKGGAYFFADTDVMVFTDHPFISLGWSFKEPI